MICHARRIRGIPRAIYSHYVKRADDFFLPRKETVLIVLCIDLHLGKYALADFFQVTKLSALTREIYSRFCEFIRQTRDLYWRLWTNFEPRNSQLMITN